MPAEFVSAIAFLAGALVAMVGSCQLVSKAAQLQQEILKRGVQAQGRILRVWRPAVLSGQRDNTEYLELRNIRSTASFGRKIRVGDRLMAG